MKDKEVTPIPIIIEKVVDHFETEDLPYVIGEGLLGKHPDDDVWDYTLVRDDANGLYYNDVDYMPIEMLEESLNRLKDKGATHVQIAHHCDHQSYYFYGSNFTVLSKEAVDAKNRKELEIQIMADKISLGLEETQIAVKKKRIAEMENELKNI